MKGCYKVSWYTCGGKKVPIQSNALTMYAFNFTKLVEKAKALSFHNSYVGIIQARRGEVGRKETWKPYAAVYNGCEKDEKSRKQMFHDWGGCDGIVDCPWTCSHVLYYIQERNARRLK